MLNNYINMHAASGLCTHGVSNVGGVTTGLALHNSSNVGGVTAGQVRHNSSTVKDCIAWNGKESGMKRIAVTQCNTHTSTSHMEPIHLKQ